ncbi:MAG TPA: hypothetical protein VGB96_12835 [Archangium sp.]
MTAVSNKHSPWILVPALLLTLMACGGTDGRPTDPPKDDPPAGSSCQRAEDCTALSCNCRDGQVSSYRSCSVVNGKGTCATCESACADKGGVSDAPAACLDSRDGSSSSFRGSNPIGSSCNKDSIQHGCSSALCINDGTGTGFCTDACTSDADCNGLKCQSYTASGRTFRYCLQASKTWCNR